MVRNRHSTRFLRKRDDTKRRGEVPFPAVDLEAPRGDQRIGERLAGLVEKRLDRNDGGGRRFWHAGDQFQIKAKVRTGRVGLVNFDCHYICGLKKRNRDNRIFVVGVFSVRTGGRRGNGRVGDFTVRHVGAQDLPPVDVNDRPVVAHKTDLCDRQIRRREEGMAEVSGNRVRCSAASNNRALIAIAVTKWSRDRSANRIRCILLPSNR